MHYPLASFAVLGLLLTGNLAFAEDVDTPDIPKPLKVMPSKIKPLQSGEDELSKAAPENYTETQGQKKNLESLSPRPAYGFQSDFWAGISRSDLAAFLAKPIPIIHDRAVRELTLKAVLAPSPELPDAQKTDENIYALRLQKLVSMGGFDDAQKLYKINESAPPTALAAESAIESSLGNNEIAVACLDQKTFDNNLKLTPVFWEHIDIFCQTLLGPAANQDDGTRLRNASRAYLEIVKPTISNSNDINQLDAVTTIALIRTDRLNHFISKSDDIKTIDDKHLALLFEFSPRKQSSLPMIAEGLKRGIIQPDEVLDFLKLVDRGNQRLAYLEPPLYTEFLKEYFKTPESPRVTDKLLELAVGDPVKETLLYPLYTASKMTIPESNRALSLRLLLLTNQDLPSNLVRSTYHLEIDTENETTSGESLLINTLLSKENSANKNEPNVSNTVLLALAYANYPQKELKNAYDNIFNLTAPSNYVMPSSEILSSLKKSADKKQINQVVIKCLAILSDTPLENLHPAALYRVLEALDSAGLKEETLSLSREVIGAVLEK